MIIVDQDKMLILNFKEISNVCISLVPGGDYAIKVFQKDEEQDIEIGNYKTLERAEEVLKEIINVYSMFEDIKYMRRGSVTPQQLIAGVPPYNAKVRYFDVYEMPGE